ncbi:MAG: 2-hydroxychromene-2-carboxylate isomerase [Alphaproteobacteria bacterium]|nr:2-hydroxychromene-2-carboxylate isomerase [Alphaproteobacteria bacterium]
MRSISWYFDYVSPFAYLQSTRLAEVAKQADITFKPVLFAGMLRHWEHKGPAEIPGKRILTFRHAQWLANKMGVPYHLPESHPFNPLKALRLTIALGCTTEVVESIFETIWVDGLTPDSEKGWFAITKKLGIENPEELLSTPEVKATLQNNGTQALTVNIFGVPTFEIDGELFWGVDTTDMLLDYLDNPGLFEENEMKRIFQVEPSTVRRR